IVSGKLQLELRPVRLQPVVEAAIAAIRPQVEENGLTLDVDLAAPDARIAGDPERLQQVTGNLLSNALKFSPAGGRITVRLVTDRTNAILTVADTGEGIEPAFLPHVFDRFLQADSSSRRAHGGLGLGLAIVRYLVEWHHGTVAAASPGRNRGA